MPRYISRVGFVTGAAVTVLGITLLILGLKITPESPRKPPGRAGEYATTRSHRSRIQGVLDQAFHVEKTVETRDPVAWSALPQPTAPLTRNALKLPLTDPSPTVIPQLTPAPTSLPVARRLYAPAPTKRSDRPVMVEVLPTRGPTVVARPLPPPKGSPGGRFAQVA